MMVAIFIPVNGSLAQLVEQETLNLLVVGSIPTRPTNLINIINNLGEHGRRESPLI